MERDRKKHGLSKAEKISIPIIIVIVLWVAYSLTQPSQLTQSQSQTLYSSASGFSNAPDFSLPVVGPNGPTGQTVTLSSFHGKVVLLEFMEPWCPHCQKMAPILEKLYEQYRANVIFISVSGPSQGATATDTAKFVRDYGSNWIYLYDSSGSTENTYGVVGTPTLIVVGKDGSIVTRLDGEQTYETLASILTQASG